MEKKPYPTPTPSDLHFRQNLVLIFSPANLETLTGACLQAAAQDLCPNTGFIGHGSSWSRAQSLP